jgi:hypothetical protein
MSLWRIHTADDLTTNFGDLAASMASRVPSSGGGQDFLVNAVAGLIQINTPTSPLVNIAVNDQGFSDCRNGKSLWFWLQPSERSRHRCADLIQTASLHCGVSHVFKNK